MLAGIELEWIIAEGGFDHQHIGARLRHAFHESIEVLALRLEARRIEVAGDNAEIGTHVARLVQPTMGLGHGAPSGDRRRSAAASLGHFLVTTTPTARQKWFRSNPLTPGHKGESRNDRPVIEAFIISGFALERRSIFASLQESETSPRC